MGACIHKLSILVEYTHIHTHTKLVILVFLEEKDGQPRAWGMRETDFLHCLNSVIMKLGYFFLWLLQNGALL